ncbi:MAG: 1-phosphofructokinase [Cohnella sp.]|uniref:1-phosphofructokinase family hexose kinase n=1 Tax=Cohnella sp. TaxID=1883426 RepID=UPI000E37BF88|nr:1-phosphofructokinase family hexose kinase [Cohnella sp.]REK66610.1 MAG: 1-phosphofructokinase [Cohnella sp.]
MITTVTLNAAIDKMYIVNNFETDRINRVKTMKAQPGGKGNNVAKVAKLLGSDVTACNFLGGENGSFVHRQLIDRGIRSDPVWIKDQTRIALNIMDQVRGTQTEILEPGPQIRPDEWLTLKGKIRDLSVKSSVVAFSGSLPRGLPADAYAQLIAAVKETGRLTILDTSGPALSSGINGSPFLCKPNRDELKDLVDRDVESTREIIAAANSLHQRGVQMVLVSLDKEGSVLITPNKAWKITPPSIRPVNTVGCGDSLVAGIAHFLDLHGITDESSLLESVVWGTAAAASNALYPIAGHVNDAEVKRFLPQIQVAEL